MIEKNIQTINLIIDSKHRDKSKYPNTNYFVYEFDDVIKDIVSIELVYALVDIEPGKTNERYINISIPEIEDTVITNISKNSFTQIPLINFSPNSVEYFRTKFVSMKIFTNPLSKMSKITVISTNQNGLPFEYYNECLFRFEIKHILKQI